MTLKAETTDLNFLAGTFMIIQVKFLGQKI